MEKVNGIIPDLTPPPAPVPLGVVAGIEAALALMVTALAGLGFSEYEAGVVNMTTRAAITDIVKQRRRPTR